MQDVTRVQLCHALGHVRSRLEDCIVVHRPGQRPERMLVQRVAQAAAIAEFEHELDLRTKENERTEEQARSVSRALLGTYEQGVK